MGKVDFRRLSLKERRKLEESVRGLLYSFKKPEEIHTFLCNILTQSEHVMLGRRIQIAKLLMGGVTQFTICEHLGVGLSTVQSIDRWLRQTFQDYRTVLSKLYQEMQQQEKRERPIEPLSFRWLRRKYPMHFLLFNLLLDDIEWNRNIKPLVAHHYKPLKGKKSSRSIN